MKFARVSRSHRKRLEYCVPEDASLWVLVDENSARFAQSRLLPKTIFLRLLRTRPADPSDLFSSGIEYLMIPPMDSDADENRPRLLQTLQKECRLVAELPTYGEIYFLGPVRFSPVAEPCRIVAILAAYNEARFINACLENLISQGIEVYLLDNGSTDQTAEIAKKWLGKGLIDIEYLPRNGTFQLQTQLQRKQELTAELEADWFMHVDADEILGPPLGDWNLAQAITAVAEAGYNMINFQEYTFVPTSEFPDHDHAHYQQTMRHYYPFAKLTPFGIRAWKNGPEPVNLTGSGGHRPFFAGMRLCPLFFVNKHYQFLSASYAIRKYGKTVYDPDELSSGWHGGHSGWREQFPQTDFPLPRVRDLHVLEPGQNLDASNPWKVHYLEQLASNLKRPQAVPDPDVAS